MAKAGVLALLYLLAFLGGGTGGALAQDENGTTSAAIQKLTELIDYDTGDFADFSNIEESVQEYAAASDSVTCEPIPEEEWGDPTPDCTEFVELDGKRKKLVNSIDGAWPSVAGTVGRVSQTHARALTHTNFDERTFILTFILTFVLTVSPRFSPWETARPF